MNRDKVFKFWAVLFLTFNFQLLTFNYCHAGAGRAGAAFLKIGVGARPVAMGEAFTAVADDVNAIYWNPAGLTQIVNKELSFMHDSWLQGINYEYIAYGQSLANCGSIAFSLAYLGTDYMESLDGSGNKSGSMDASDILVNAAYAKAFGSFSFGANFKVIQERLASYSATGIGVDLGMLKKFDESISMGLAVQNIGTPLSFIEASKASPLPLCVKAGGSLKLPDCNCTLAADIGYFVPEAKISVQLGAEYWCNKVLALRFGYRTAAAADIDPLAGLTAGFGFRWENCGIDYAFVPYGNLGQAHRISLVAALGAAPDKAADSGAGKSIIAMPKVKSELKGKSVMLYWAGNEEAGVAGYKIYMRKGMDEDYKCVSVKPVDESYFVFGEIEKGTTYYFAVTAFTADSPARETPMANEIRITAPDILAQAVK